MRPLRDPAPSRMAYRLNRLMLTPGFRRFLRYGLPALLLAAGVAIWASDEARRQDAADRVAEVKRQIQERPEFMVRMMAVERASAAVDAEVRARVPLDFPVSSFDLELQDIQRAVEEIDAVKSAAVHIRQGGVLSVEVEEREPVVVWRTGEGLMLLDVTGARVAMLDNRTERGDLPLLVGIGARDHVEEALELFAAAEPVAGRLRALARIGERRWDVVLDRDQRIMLPEDEAKVALDKVIALDRAQDLLARDIAAIDFRNPRRPVLRLTETALGEMVHAGWDETKEPEE
ncbi:MAG: cell division protein FtsQ/DivIB [Pseudomonadota bacterium]